MAARSGDSHDVRQPDEEAEHFTLHEDQWGFVFSPSASMRLVVRRPSASSSMPSISS